MSKEFFQLLVRSLFSGDYGMFDYNDETREQWFSPAAMEMGVAGNDFRLVGIVRSSTSTWYCYKFKTALSDQSFRFSG